jgi:hypothetical protein
MAIRDSKQFSRKTRVDLDVPAGELAHGGGLAHPVEAFRSPCQQLQFALGTAVAYGFQLAPKGAAGTPRARGGLR